MASWQEHPPEIEAAAADLFEARWYARKYGLDNDMPSAWQHYREVGRFKGYRPNPLFDPVWYHNSYLECALGDGLLHFVAQGATRGLWPSPLFETDWYRDTNPDVAVAGVNLLAHYLHWGRNEARAPTAWAFDAKDVGSSRDLALPADFQSDDLLGYFPYYHSISRLALDPDPMAFFAPASPRWIFARVSFWEAIPALINGAMVIGGRREVLIDGHAFGPQPEARSIRTYRAFAVTHSISPVLRDAVHLLGVDWATEANAEWVIAMLGRNFATAPVGPILVDLNLSDEQRRAILHQIDAKSILVPIARGAMCRATRLRSLPITARYPNGQHSPAQASRSCRV